jgi:hypothetical protein
MRKKKKEREERRGKKNVHITSHNYLCLIFFLDGFVRFPKDFAASLVR